MTKQEILKTHFGYDTFREGQEAVIDALLAEKDVLAVMPTGAGKSICYQVPALMMKGITLVISPLISLMKDQVRSLNQVRNLSGIPQQLSDAGTVFYSFALCKSRTISDHLCSTGAAYHRGVSGFCAECGYFHDRSG